MERCFLQSNPGLSRRFNNSIDLVNYGYQDLFLMFFKRTYVDIYNYLRANQNINSNQYIDKMLSIFKYLDDRKVYFPNQGGDIGNLTSNFYSYFYSQNDPVSSIIGAVYDMGINKKIPSQILKNDIQALYQL